MRTFSGLLAKLDAHTLDVPFDDYLSAVAVLHAPAPLVAARAAPLTLTLDQVHRVAWFHGLDLHVALTRRDQPAVEG